MSFKCKRNKNQTRLECLNSKRSHIEKLNAYLYLQREFPRSVLQYYTMDEWFNRINDSMRDNSMTSGQRVLFTFYKNKLKEQISLMQEKPAMPSPPPIRKIKENDIPGLLLLIAILFGFIISVLLGVLLH